MIIEPQLELTQLERRVGPQLVLGDAFTFRCPLCRKYFRYGHRYAPMCTGPSEMLDEHPPESMHLVKIDKREIDPILGEGLANGPLILPRGFVAS